MIQDISPKHLDNQYKNVSIQDNDTVFFFQESSLLARETGDELEYPHYCEFIQGIKNVFGKDSVDNFEFTYLLSVDEERYFLASRKGHVQKGQFIGEMADSKVHGELDSFIEGFSFYGVNSFRKAMPKYRAYAAITSYHLFCWYRDNRFCGRCGEKLIHDHKERMMRCTCCNNMVFPKICPAVIVAVTNKDKLLLTKYADRAYKNYALIAGFTEIGESTEECVEREVMEEVGLKVKNIRYYKSQPWGLSGSQLYGYFCELDGDDTITLQEDELSVGTWVQAGDIDVVDDDISLTREMIEKFRRENI